MKKIHKLWFYHPFLSLSCTGNTVQVIFRRKWNQTPAHSQSVSSAGVQVMLASTRGRQSVLRKQRGLKEGVSVLGH